MPDCDIPRSLPWYFGIVIAAVWLATVAGILLLFRRWVAVRLEERRRRKHAHSGRREIDSTGRDVELW